MQFFKKNVGCVPKNGKLTFKSNSESGDGYADITFLDEEGNKADILELKVAENTKKMKETELLVIKQIEDKRYAHEFIDDIITEIYCYGISFCQKECFIEMKKFK